MVVALSGPTSGFGDPLPAPVWPLNEVPARRVSAGVWLERGECPPRSFPAVAEEDDVTGVMIAVDPHKGSRTAVAV
jgi:hypothetical protein